MHFLAVYYQTGVMLYAVVLCCAVLCLELVFRTETGALNKIYVRIVGLRRMPTAYARSRYSSVVESRDSYWKGRVGVPAGEAG